MGSTMTIAYRDFWAAGFAVLGIFSIDDYGQCACGDHTCKAAGKHPRHKGWQNAPRMTEHELVAAESAGDFLTGYGVRCDGMLVIDVDARNGGVEAFERLRGNIPAVDGAGLIVNTGSGGGSRHLYFKLPIGIALRPTHEDYPGLDFKTSGFVVGPGSRHKSRATYEIAYGSVGNIGEAPQALIDLLRKPVLRPVGVIGVNPHPADPSVIADMLSYIDPDTDYQTWLNCGMAIHNDTQGAGFDLWNNWSSKGTKYPGASELQLKWGSFTGRATPITLGTLVHHAKQWGWKPQPNLGLKFVRPDGWPTPKPIPEGLLPVARFDPKMLPDCIAPWVCDIGERMQCPLDFVAIPALVALAATLGRRIGVRPQRKSDWVEVPNLWGVIVGRPGTLKSPAMKESTKPLQHLEDKARAKYARERDMFAIEAEAFKLKKEDVTKKARKAIEDGKHNIAEILAVPAPEEPIARRYIVNDTTYEALGEVLSANPNGVLALRDELVSFLKSLDREDNAAARGFLLTAWNGNSTYAFDRIVRGKTHIDGICVSLIGSTQPGLLANYIRRATIGGVGDDGLIQRFSLMVWPDPYPAWKLVDQYPNATARSVAFATFERLDALDPLAVGAQRDAFDKLAYLHFDDGAQTVFDEWRHHLESRLRSGDMSPALESHLAKYRKLVPALALIDHLTDGGVGAIGEKSILRALLIADYLETHARRAYAAGSEAEASAAKAILKRIKSGDLDDGFSAREIQRKCWTHLGDRESIKAGLELLCDLDWIAESVASTGGRPSVTYSINPAARS